MKSRTLMCVVAGAALLAACSSDSGTGGAGHGGTGGQSNGGGGGAGQGGTGGAEGTGGKTSTGDGTGGQSVGGSSGGAGAAGGGAAGQAAGGATGGGGATGTGGKGGSQQGGSTGVGGASGTGGSSPDGGGKGGAIVDGGATGAGGKTGSGGATGDGGGTGAGGSTGTGTSHWVGTWTASPYYDSGNQPPSSLANSVLRQVTHVSLGGSQIRVQFSNLGGNGSVTISSAHVALCKATPAVDSTIDTATDKALAFSGTASVTIAQGKEVWSDPVDFTAPNQGNITITTAFGSVPSQVVGHSGSRTTSYLATGSNVTAASMTSATTFQHWYYISGIDVMADASAKGVVAIGDSITDGRGTDNDKNNRWTDIMAARLQANAATANVATMNQGIGATNLVGSSSNAAQGRFKRDVVGQSGVRYAIVLDGGNDIHGGATFASMKAAYGDLISQAHAAKLLIYGATITPFGGDSDYYSTGAESVRQQVNTYIKSATSGFDGYIDFDAAVTDGGNPPKLKADYAAWTPANPAGSADGLHPGPAGYKAMGDSVDLTQFTK